MGFSIEKIKQEFARNRKRAAILGVLSLVLVGFAIKAYFEMSPRNAAADALDVNSAATPAAEPTLTVAETDARIRQSKELWKTLRMKRGVSPVEAFTFAPTYYPTDPNRPVHPIQTNVGDAAPHLVTSANANNQEADRVARIKELAGKLIVTSTVVGTGNSRPVAVVSGRIVAVGDRIFDFEVMSIKAREVEFKMEGVTLVVTMAGSEKPSDLLHGQ